jgi:hypothetical protein
MAPRQSVRTGILVVRVWIEADADDGFRARVTRTLDASVPEQSTVAAASPDETYAVVRSWVEAFVTSHRPAAGPVTLP